MKTVKLSSKNQIVIPTEVRSRLGVKSGDRIIIESSSNQAVTLKKEPAYRDLIGSVPNSGEDPVVRVRAVRAEWSG